MAEAEHDQQPPKREMRTEELVREIAASQVPDWWLGAMVSIHNRSEDASFGITLMVGGILITGDLVSGRTYFTGQAEEVKAIGTGTGLEGFIAGLEVGAQAYPVEEFDEETADPSSPRYIHLRNAQVVAPSGFMPARGMWWRGRLTSVDGFWIGKLSSSE